MITTFYFLFIRKLLIFIFADYSDTGEIRKILFQILNIATINEVFWVLKIFVISQVFLSSFKYFFQRNKQKFIILVAVKDLFLTKNRSNDKG